MKKKKGLDFEPQKMVGWFDVGQLAGTGVRAVLSSLFGNYADKREILASISDPTVFREYSTDEELWLDYLSDTGDGFNSVYSMATLLATDVLDVQHGTHMHSLKRAKVLVLGGDQVYPTPTRTEYTNRFIGPFSKASENIDKEDRSHMFAVPGNHDWYDGLNNFVKTFCQKKVIGGWQTRQTRSYFAIQLTKTTWLWAIDIQLESDIDAPQMKYFDNVGNDCMTAGDNVILCSAEPSWVYHTARRNEPIYQNLAYFESNFIRKKGFNQPLTLAGDLHHYARYSQTDEHGRYHHKLTAGGGGAFLHPTHNLPKKLINMYEGDFDLKKTYPSRTESRRLAFGNLFFAFKNISFGWFMATVYLLFAWMMYTVSYLDHEPGNIFTDIQTLGLSDINQAYRRLAQSFINSPASLGIIMIFAIGFYKFCDANSSKYRYISFVGALHGLFHIVIMLCSLWACIYFNYNELGIDEIVKSTLMMSFESFFIGGAIAGTTVGIYLLFCNLVLGIHDNEAFSSMKIQGYKNFLRIHVLNNKITVYPIGLKKIAKWKFVNGTFVTNQKLEPFLIEEPLTIEG